jgi:hypothetical protein
LFSKYNKITGVHNKRRYYKQIIQIILHGFGAFLATHDSALMIISLFKKKEFLVANDFLIFLVF